MCFNMRCYSGMIPMESPAGISFAAVFSCYMFSTVVLYVQSNILIQHPLYDFLSFIKLSY